MTAPVPVVRADVLPSPHRGTLPALLCAVLSFSLMQTLLVPALPALVADLRLDATGGGWILTSYLLSGAVAAPILGALGDRHGHRRVLLAAMVVFVLGGALCATGASMLVFLAGRVLQGAATASFPLALAIVRRHLAPERQSVAVGWLSGTLGLGAGVALVVGGAIAQALSWPWLFVTGAVLGVLSVVLVAAFVPASPRTPSHGRAEVPGAVLLAVALLSLLLAVSQSAAWGPAATAGSALLACAALVAFWLVERRSVQPLIDVRVLARPALALVNALTLLLGFIPYLFYVGLPMLLQAIPPRGFGIDVAGTGLAMLPGAILVFLGGRLTPALSRRLPPAAVAALALAVMAAGGLGASLMPGSLLAVIVFFALVGLGNGIGFALAADLVSRLVPRDEIAAAVGVNGVLRTVGSAFGTPVTMLIVGGASGGGEGFVTVFAVATAAAVLGVAIGGAIRVAGRRT